MNETEHVEKNTPDERKTKKVEKNKRSLDTKGQQQPQAKR